ncbi:hypothetical protein F5Y04DRAFT_31850 [Hypomontagnella monticulosa]|nr:hypothetical protein F5Y04DRAFT_31850 [Hypomontagnella monticulosa]
MIERFRVIGDAIVAGGGGNLGSTASRALLQHGLTGLALFDLDPVAGEQRVEWLKADFPSVNIMFQKVNITKPYNVKNAVEEVTTSLWPINMLLNFAGTAWCYSTLSVRRII